MPEGDTIHKLSRRLQEYLVEEEMRRCFIKGQRLGKKLEGRRVVKVEALGKHTLIQFDEDYLLRVHLGMHGSWHRYPEGAPWKRAKSSASVVLTTQTQELVCFKAMEVELFPRAQRQWNPKLKGLGPDLLGSEEPCYQAVSRRVAKLCPPDTYLGEVLLDQRLACGIGNVYKSELAFLGPLANSAFEPNDFGYNPWRSIASIPTEHLESLYRRARAQLQANLGGWWRTTTVDRRTQAEPAERLFVYGRVGKPCFRCGHKIKRAFQGLQNRVTYWCPSCQKD